MLNLKLALFKIKNFFIIIKSRLLKKKISLKYKENKKNFEKLVEKKSFSHKWFLNNFEIFSHYLPKELNKELSYLEIGSGNTIREYVSINRGTSNGGGKTSIGSNNWIMAYVHIAHDCCIGNNSTFANNTTLAGHVSIGDFVILGGFTGVHQFCRVGNYSFSAISSVIVKDVPPYILVSGNTAKPSGLNREGLKRNGFNSDDINLLKKAYRIIYRDGYILTEALEELLKISKDSKEVELLYSFISSSERGIVR